MIADLPLPAEAILAVAALGCLFLYSAISARRLGREAAAARAEAATLRGEADRIGRDLAAARLSAATLESRAAERDTRLAELRDELGAARADVTAARASLAESQATCARLAEAVDRLEAAARQMAAERNAALARLDTATAELRALDASHQALKADVDGKLDSARREVETLKRLRDEMLRQFEELANKTLIQTGAHFSRTHESKLQELLNPFREHVDKLQLELREVHQSADKERSRLGEQIRQLTERSEAISQEAVALTRALKGDKQRQGAWGEMILERILEDSGLLRDVHYELQVQLRDDEGSRLRPDVIVRLPRDKCLIIDSKVSLIDYEIASRAETEEERGAALARHTLAIRRHIDALSSKDYQMLEGGTVDHVLMFMPIEGALSEAWRLQGDLTSYAIGRGVTIVTPTTLMLALKTVDHIWTVERREQNAEAIAHRAGRLYDKLHGFVADMQRVGSALGTASKAHDDAMGKLASGRGNLLGQAQKLKAMGARTAKSIALACDPDEDEEEAPQALPQPAE